MTLICQFCQCFQGVLAFFGERIQTLEAGCHKNRKPLGTGDSEWYRQVTSLQFSSTRQDRRVARKVENTSRDCLAFRGGLRLRVGNPG